MPKAADYLKRARELGRVVEGVCSLICFSIYRRAELIEYALSCEPLAMIYDYVSLGAFAEGWGTTVGMNKHKALYPGRHTDAELDQDPGKARTLDVNMKLWDECALVFHRFGINKVQELVGAHATRRGQLVSEIPSFGDLNAVHLSHREQLPYGKTLADFWIASYLERAGRDSGPLRNHVFHLARLRAAEKTSLTVPATFRKYAPVG